MRASDPESLSVEAFEARGQAHSRGAEQARELASQFFAFKDNYDDMNFTAPYLSTITASTLIVHGDRDQFFPVSIPVEEYEAIPDSYLWIVPNGGHGAALGSERGRTMFSELVLDFLAGEWRRNVERVAITVSSEILADYVGTYDMAGQDWVVTLEDNRLMIEAPGFGKFQAFAESETHFFNAAGESEFVRGDDGIVTHLIVQYRGNEMTAPRKSNDG